MDIAVGAMNPSLYAPLPHSYPGKVASLPLELTIDPIASTPLEAGGVTMLDVPPPPPQPAIKMAIAKTLKNITPLQ
jgi:hypothetical protein